MESAESSSLDLVPMITALLIKPTKARFLLLQRASGLRGLCISLRVTKAHVHTCTGYLMEATPY